MNPQLQLMLQQAIQAFQSDNFDSADSILKRVVKVDSKNLPALHILGLIKASQEKFREAADLLVRAARLDPRDPSIQYNLAKALADCGSDKESIPHHKKAVELAPTNPEAWLNYGKTLSNLKRYEEALITYSKALTLKPIYAEAALNIGATLKELKRFEEALIYADQALDINPTLFEAWANKGAALRQLKRQDEAITCYEKALNLKPDNAQDWVNKGITLHELKRYDEAITCYEKALSLKPDIDWIYGDLIHTKLKIGYWNNLQQEVNSLITQIHTQLKVIQPFALLAFSDDASLHKKSAEIYAQDKYPFNPILGSIPARKKKEKIRLGYFSSDFQNHPVAHLTSELFELHDRSRFELFAFSLQAAPENNEMRLRLKKGFDHFIDAENISDQDIAQLARKLEIDIAIDLTGPTAHSRTGIFAHRAAPIQINWLGYPGTLGAQFMDYIVADPIIIPESSRQHYAEKVVYLPHTYMVDDSKRTSSSRIFTKQECGLPEDALVFCCFNNDYKFNEQVLDSWSRILQRVDQSVLWISENNKQFQENIALEFSKRGIDSNRIVFAQRVELMGDHLARYALADVFLDTYPYNAHTTAVDSLKAGVPVITLLGSSFAGRVAASLLNAIGLPELIANTPQEYEALAIELAMNSQRLADIKFKLVANRLTTPLFDTALFSRNLESSYIQMYERHQAKLQPDHISIV